MNTRAISVEIETTGEGWALVGGGGCLSLERCGDTTGRDSAPLVDGDRADVRDCAVRVHCPVVGGQQRGVEHEGDGHAAGCAGEAHGAVEVALLLIAAGCPGDVLRERLLVAGRAGREDVAGDLLRVLVAAHIRSHLAVAHDMLEMRLPFSLVE